MSERTGGRILVDQLLLHGVDRIFCVPGESYLAALDALYDAGVDLVVCRMEAGAADMAEADGKLTGRPGICFVTRGPGATHACVGVHTAMQDSTPMILLVGQVAREHRRREAFQEVDFEAMFAPLAKWAVEVDDVRRLPEVVGRAFAVATSGRPGPVVISLPEDLLEEVADVPDAPAPSGPHQARVVPADAEAARAILAAAERPLVLVGGGLWSTQAADDLRAWAEASRLPVCTSFRRQSYLDNRSDAYIGWAGVGIDPKLAQRIRDCDTLLCLGARLGEATTSGYTILTAPDTGKRLVHVYPDPDELGRVYQPELGVVGSPVGFVAALRALPPLDPARWAAWTEAARVEHLAQLDRQPVPGPLDMGAVVEHLRERLPSDAILTTGAGNFAVWLQRFYRFTEYRTHLAPTSGAMGYGLPAAVAAKARYPDRHVVALCGDGDFLMTGQELATAVRQRANLVVMVVNNGMYGTIRMHQERHYPGRVVGTELVNPDFAAYARSFGAYGEAVERSEDFPAAFGRALDAGVPALLELRVDPEALTPRQSLSQIRAAALGGS
ncbi:MAG: thiamine pyrophosphate-binding protein [Thermoleophilia bacterium]